MSRFPIFALVPAAGLGVRVGLGVSKALLPLGEYSILEHTINALSSCKEITYLIVVGRASDKDDILKMQSRFAINFVEGGETRQHSVRNGLEFIATTLNAPPESIVVIHDAARCFVSPPLLSRSIKEAEIHKAVTAGIPSFDSLMRVSGDSIFESTLPREGVWQVQTPQTFRLDIVRRAHAEVKKETTDDASLVSSIQKVKVILGERANIKITSREDYESAKGRFA